MNGEDARTASPLYPSPRGEGGAVLGLVDARFGEDPATALPVARLRETGERRTLLGIAFFCAMVLGVAGLLHPDPRGYGTHEQLGLLRCGFKHLTGWPCPTCGMTTAFAWAVRGDLALAWSVQPFAAVLALLTPIVGLVCAGFALANRSLSARLGPGFWFWSLWVTAAGLLTAWLSKIVC